MAVKKNHKKHSVKLRERELKDGNRSLYLDVWYNGQRKYEFLKLYIIPPKSPLDRESNKKTRELAESIRAKRQLELQDKVHGFYSDFKLNTRFLEYFESLIEKRKNSKGNFGNWLSTLKHLKEYCDHNITFSDIDIRFVEGFKSYLENDARTKSKTSLSTNSQHSYFNKFKAALNKAFEDRLIPENPCKRVKGIKSEDPHREYLSLDEVKKLVKIECKYPVLKDAFLFSCLTGLRWSDIQKLTWSEVQEHNGGWRVIFRQRKTKGQEYLDISGQARNLLGEKGEPDERVFVGLKYSAWHNVELKRWMLKAGITKDITFHCARHTFAVLQLDLGTDIYTVSKLLGHSELKTTQIYAKIIDRKKKEAMDKIPDINLSDGKD